MESKRLTNLLLSLIAACLIVLTVESVTEKNVEAQFLDPLNRIVNVKIVGVGSSMKRGIPVNIQNIVPIGVDVRNVFPIPVHAQ